GEDARRRRLAGAVEAEKAYNFAAIDLKADLVDRQDGAEELRQMFNLNHGRSWFWGQTSPANRRIPVALPAIRRGLIYRAAGGTSSLSRLRVSRSPRQAANPQAGRMLPFSACLWRALPPR